MEEKLNPPQFIRRHVFRMSQHKFSRAIGKTQGAVSCMERRGDVGKWSTGLDILKLAEKRKIPFKLEWLMRVPKDYRKHMRSGDPA